MKKSRKAINFDLSEEKLKLYYPKKNYRQAWYDINQFFNDNGFLHRQKSGYVSEKSMSRIEIFEFVGKLFIKFPWLPKSADVIDVTNIGKTHNLLELYSTHLSLGEKNQYKQQKNAVDSAPPKREFYVRITHEQLKKLIDSGIPFEMKRSPTDCMIRYSSEHRDKVEKILSSIKKQNRQTKR